MARSDFDKLPRMKYQAPSPRLPRSPPPPPPPQLGDSLTSDEKRILAEMRKGRTSHNEIGKFLSLSSAAVVGSLRDIERKLGMPPLAYLLRPRWLSRRQIVRNRLQIISYSRVIVFALEETLRYDSRRHNHPPPDLWLDDTAYLEELRNLVAELRRLNSLLEQTNPPSDVAKERLTKLNDHFHKFLEGYSEALGKGAAALTIGSMAALLYHAGFGKDILDSIWGHIKLPK
jgi:hypothetical protein